MNYFLLIPVMVLVLWIASIICVKTWLDYSSYKFILKEAEADTDLNSYDEVFYTKNSDTNNPKSPPSWLLLKIIELISRN
jgi:hypothetical protein